MYSPFDAALARGAAKRTVAHRNENRYCEQPAPRSGSGERRSVPARLRAARAVGAAPRAARSRPDLPRHDTVQRRRHANDRALMGVPLLTCAGETMSSRVAGSQLHAVGLPELVTTSLAAYESLALELIVPTNAATTYRNASSPIATPAAVRFGRYAGYSLTHGAQSGGSARRHAGVNRICSDSIAPWASNSCPCPARIRAASSCRQATSATTLLAMPR